VAKKQHIKARALNEPHTAQAMPLSHGHFTSLRRGSPSSSWSALRLSELCPCKQLHASSQASTVAAAAPAPVPVEDFEQQMGEKSSQHWAAIST